jgi:hypothetical protein
LACGNPVGYRMPDGGCRLNSTPSGILNQQP